jgi:hypothetical protein
MCVCDPMKRTPYCGNIGCEWPGKEKLGSKLEESPILGGHTIQYPYASVFTIPEDNIFDPKELDMKEVTLRVITEGEFMSIYAIKYGKTYFLSQTKQVPGRVGPDVQNDQQPNLFPKSNQTSPWEDKSTCTKQSTTKHRLMRL